MLLWKPHPLLVGHKSTIVISSRWFVFLLPFSISQHIFFLTLTFGFAFYIIIPALLLTLTLWNMTLDMTLTLTSTMCFPLSTLFCTLPDQCRIRNKFIFWSLFFRWILKITNIIMNYLPRIKIKLDYCNKIFKFTYLHFKQTRNITYNLPVNTYTQCLDTPLSHLRQMMQKNGEYKIYRVPALGLGQIWNLDRLEKI